MIVWVNSIVASSCCTVMPISRSGTN
jgi:hypothetical protein